MTSPRLSLPLLAVAWLVACANPPGGSASTPRPASRVVDAPTSAIPPPGLPPAVAPSQPPSAAAPRAAAPAVRPSLPSPALPTPAPVSAGVAARFPEPAVTFATPAFEPGRSAFTRNDELRAALDRLAANAPAGRVGTDVRVVELGTSQDGEPIVAISFTRPVEAAPPPGSASVATPPAPVRRPAVLLIAGQHGDEPAGTEALLVLADALAAGRRDAVLARVDVTLVPLANPDGHARFQRSTRDGTDLNRDHLLLRTPEAQALAQLVVALDPVVVADFHEYPVDGAFAARFGALPRHDVLLQAATTPNLPPFVSRAAEEWFRRPLATRLAGAGFSTDWYHTVSDGGADRRVSMGGTAAGIARNAFGLRNAVSLLVETRGGGIGRVDLKRRVQASLLAADSVLDSATARAGDLLKLHEFVDRDVAAKACQGELVIEAAPTASEYVLQMLDPATGEVRRTTVNWDSALELRALRMRPRPCGYWLAASQADAVARLRRLGVEVQQLDEAGDLRGESWRETSRSAPPAAEPDEPPRLRAQVQPALLDVPAGSYYVSLEQPLANLAVAALEPEAPGSFAAARVVGAVGDEARVMARPQAKMSPMP